MNKEFSIEKDKMINEMKIWIMVSAILAVVFYLLHDIIGAINYPGYKWTEQAVSDLTAVDAPSRGIANSLTKIHGIFCCLCYAFICVLAKSQRKAMKTGLYLLTAMHATSAIGYSLFPLTSSGYDGTVQSFIHVYVLTAVVVLLSISSMTLIAIGCFKDNRKALGITTIVALVLMASGPICMVLPKEVFGIFERFSTYSAVVFSGILGVFLYKDTGLKSKLA
jgi:hypothetical membrane protein